MGAAHSGRAGMWERQVEFPGRLREEEQAVITESLLQGFEAARDVEALMERMRQLQESLLRDEGASQEEMESRFELEKSESLLVTPSGMGS